MTTPRLAKGRQPEMGVGVGVESHKLEVGQGSTSAGIMERESRTGVELGVTPESRPLSPKIASTVNCREGLPFLSIE